MNTQPERMPETDLRALVSILRRRGRMIAATMGAVLGLTLLLLLFLTPKYTATALLLVDPTQKDLLSAEAAVQPGGSADNARVESEIEIARSVAVARATARAAGLALDPEFGPGPGAGDRLRALFGLAAEVPQGEAALDVARRKLREATRIERRGLTHVFAVSVTSKSPERAAELANTLARTYIDLQVAAKVGAVEKARDLLLGQLESARTRLAASDDGVDGYIRRNLQALASEAGNPRLIGLQEDLQRLNAVRTGLSEQVGQGGAELERELARTDAAIASTRGALREAVLSSDLPSARLAEMFELQQEAEIAQRQYTNLLARLRDLDAQVLVQVADSRIVSEALPPDVASSPRYKLILSMALVFSLGAGVGVALIREFYIGGILSGRQLETVVPVSRAVSVPFVKMRRDQTCLADGIVEAPLSHFSESFRHLRTTLDRLAPPEETGRGRVVLIASAVAGEGKSTTALALARTYAQLGRSVALIDADLRKPSLHECLGVMPDHGFLEYLRDPEAEGSAEGFYLRDPLSAAGVLVGRGRADVPTDQLLMSRQFQLLLDSARDAVDVILIDTSPLNAVVDAQFIAPFADAAVLCVRFADTSQTDLRLAHARLRETLRPEVPIVAALTRDISGASGYDESGYYA
ncbi:MAG: hypothetical protein CR993_01345 [Rhodobacterales bacterium]|nr:MAG: hypothetical protein CR993_01345 [Rhodobacterales bacterium]